MTDLLFPGALNDSDALARRLADMGLSRSACRSKAALFGKAAKALAVTDCNIENHPTLAFFVPGRIEVLGKHTDYAGGRSMVAATEQGFCFAAAPRDDNEVVVIDALTGETIVFLADPELTPRTGSWANYPMTVVRRIARNFPGAARGADIALAGDIPPAAGMSSSSALLTGVSLVLSEVNRLPERDDYWHHIGEKKTDLAEYLGAVESGRNFGELAGDLGVGTFGGSEDHTAVLCCEAGRIGMFGYCPVEFEKSIAMPPGYLFAVGVSGVKAEKTGGALEKYNAASRLVSELLDLWRLETGGDEQHLAAALCSSSDAPERLKQFAVARPELANRLEHFMLESGEIIPEAGEALAVGDLHAFGMLVDRSQNAAERLLGNQVPETEFLAAAARRRGAAAASSFGAGFGGGVWAMVEAEKADEFLTGWGDEYRRQFPQRADHAKFFTTPAGPAAFRLRQE